VTKGKALTKISAESLAVKAKVLQAAYGGEGKALVLNLAGADTAGFGEAVDSLEVLLDRTVALAKE
jgi:CRISPR system Cascade subunit CasC